MNIRVSAEMPVAELQDRLAAGGLRIRPIIKGGEQRYDLEAYVAQMWDAFHLTPEQRAQKAVENVQALAEYLSKPVPLEVVK